LTESFKKRIALLALLARLIGRLRAKAMDPDDERAEGERIVAYLKGPSLALIT